MSWRKNLTKAQKAHLREHNCNTKAAFVRTREVQLAMMKTNNQMEVCWDCREIAKRLGVCQNA
jgi:hypothetical protein